MLGQPVYFLTPDVVGVELKGKLREGVTATDLVLTVTEMLRKEKVVGKFVEFFGEGAATLAVPDRATIANMAPEYGATMGFFPVDDATVDYLRSTGRTDGRDRRLRGVLQGAGPLRHAARRRDRLHEGAGARPRDDQAVARRPEAPAGPHRARAASRRGSPSSSASRSPTTASPRSPTSSRSAFKAADGVDARLRRRADRRDHLLHQHVEPERAARRRPAGEEGGRAGPHGASRTSRPRSRPARASSPTT